jgi:hypothetical protein
MAYSHIKCEDVIGVVAAVFAVLKAPARSVTNLAAGRGPSHLQYKSVTIV